MHFCDLCGSKQPLSEIDGQREKFWPLTIPVNTLRQGESR